MRVLHLLSSSGMHGAETMALQLTSALRRLGVEVTVGLFDRGDAVCDAVSRRFEDASIPVIRFRDRGRFDPRLSREIPEYARQAGVQVFHSHKAKCTLHALLGRSVPLVVTYHNWIVTSRALRVYASIDRAMCRFVDACVAVSGEVATILEAAGARVVHRVDNGVDLDQWRPTESANALRGRLDIGDALVIGFVGRLGPEKGLDLLLESVAKVPRVNGRELRVLIAGDGESRAGLEELARIRGLSKRVCFLGEYTDPSTVYAASDVIALTSLTEGFPMVVIEAMASGRPVIATAVGDLPRIIDPGVTGWLLQSRDPVVLADLIRAELGDADRLRCMGAAARAVAQQRFSSARMAAAYLEIYRKVARS